jgi:hypothetical protein
MKTRQICKSAVVNTEKEQEKRQETQFERMLGFVLQNVIVVVFEDFYIFLKHKVLNLNKTNAEKEKDN